MMMFFTWLLRFACDADLKKPPPKMVTGLHATLTVKLLGLGEIGSLSIVVLANAWISKKYVVIFAHSSILHHFFLIFLKANSQSGSFPHYPKFTSTIIPIFYIFFNVCHAFLYCWQFFKVFCSPISIFSLLSPKCLSYCFCFCFLPQTPRNSPFLSLCYNPPPVPIKKYFQQWVRLMHTEKISESEFPLPLRRFPGCHRRCMYPDGVLQICSPYNYTLRCCCEV